MRFWRSTLRFLFIALRFWRGSLRVSSMTFALSMALGMATRA
jgi:hypothetical protein